MSLGSFSQELHRAGKTQHVYVRPDHVRGLSDTLYQKEWIFFRIDYSVREWVCDTIGVSTTLYIDGRSRALWIPWLAVFLVEDVVSGQCCFEPDRVPASAFEPVDDKPMLAGGTQQGRITTRTSAEDVPVDGTYKSGEHRLSTALSRARARGLRVINGGKHVPTPDRHGPRDQKRSTPEPDSA